MSRTKFQLILFSFLILTVLLVQCKDKNEVQNRENQSTTSSESLIVSVINSLIKIKDSDFFRSGIESSVRSVFGKSFTSAAVYAMSLVAGVVAMLAFYESPVSPMPVPPLPDPPVGRFPPEHPIWPPPQREPMNMSDKKRVGIMNPFGAPNHHHQHSPQYPHNPHNQQMASASHNSPQLMFPPMNPNQKYSDVDPSGNAGAYQQLMNMLENRNSKTNNKQNINRFSGNSIAELTPQVYSSFTVESDQKVVNDSTKAQPLYSEPNDRHDSIELINKLYNQNNLNNAFDKLKEFNGFKKVSNSEALKDKDKLNYTLIASTDPNSNRRLKTKIGET